VLQRSATQYQAVLGSVERELVAERAKVGREGEGLLGRVVADGSTGWADARGWGGARV